MFRFKLLTRVLGVLPLVVQVTRASLTRPSSLILTPVVSIRARTHVRGVRSVRKLAITTAGLIILGAVGFNVASPVTTFAANDNTINFQARLMTPSGSIVPDGTYNIEFKLYNTVTSSGSSQGSCTGDASCLWVETYTGANMVNVVDGYLSVNLGTLSSFPATINWNQPLYLGMRVGGSNATPSWDAEMTPRMQLTAIPYAFMANSLSTETGTYQSTLTWATQSTSQNLLLPNRSGTLCVAGESDGCNFSGNYINNSSVQQASSNFNISGTGTAATGFTAPLLQSASGSLTVQGANGTVTLGSSTNLTASGTLTITAGGTNTALSLNTNGTGGINIGSNGSGNNSIQIGDATGAYTQAINIGNNTTSGSSTSLVLGSVVAGTLTLQSNGINQVFGGNNTITIKNSSSSNNSTTAFQVENGSSASVLDVDTTDGFVGIGTNSPGSELTVSGTNLQPGSSGSSNGIAASNALTVTGASGGNTTAATGVVGGAGAAISLQGGTGGNATGTGTVTGGAGGNISIIAGNGGNAGSAGTDGSGGQLLLRGGAAGSGGANAGSSGSVIVESNGSNSTTAFEVQSASSVNVLDVDTSNGRVSVGTSVVPANGVLTVGTATNTASGGLYFGTDTDLYRNADGSLKTDGALTVGNSLTVGSGSVVMTFNPSVTAGSSSNMFEVDGNSGTPADSDVFTANGELGVGTTSPTANLSFGSTGATVNVNASTTGTGSNLTIQGGAGKSGGNYVGGNLVLEAGAGAGTSVSGSVIVESNATNSATAFEIQNTAGTSNLLVADTVNSKIGLAEAPTSSGNTLQVAGGITATTGGILVSSGGETITAGGLNLNSTGVINTGSISGATTYSGNSTLSLTGTNANELAVTGAPLASATSSLVQIGNVIATGSPNGTYLGINAPSGNLADFLNLEENGIVELQLTSGGALTTGSTINGQTISSNASFTGTLSVGTFASNGTTQLCEASGQLATCAASIGNYINNSALTLQTSANIDIQSLASTDATVQLEDTAGQTADLIDFKSSSGAILSEITSNGYFQGANGSGLNIAGGNLDINGGQGTGNNAGGSIYLQISKPGASGSSINSLSTVATFSGATGSADFQNAVNSNGAFVVQDSSNNQLLGIDTAGDNIYIGATGTTALSSNVYIASSSSASNAQTLTAGSISSTSATTVQAGTGGLTLQAAASSTISIGANNVGGKVIDIGSVGTTAQASTIDIGNTTGSGTQNISIGSTSSTSNQVLIQGGTTSSAVGIQAGTSGTISIGTANASTLTLGNNSAGTVFSAESGTGTTQLFNGATAHTIQLATGAAAQTVTIGSTTTGSSLTLNGSGTSEVINSSGDDVTLVSGSNFVVQNSSSTVLNVSTSGVTIGSGATFGGATYVDHVTTSGTTTISSASYGYDLSYTSSSGTSTEIFDITGLPSTAGTTAYIVSSALKNGGSNVSVTVEIEINGTLMSTVTAAGTGGSINGYDDYIVMYADSMWRIVGQGPENTANVTYAQGADYAEWIDYSGTTAPQPGDVLTVGSNPASVADSSTPYDPGLIGVVSTSPYAVGGTNDGHSVVLALAGRVPVKVNLDNGPIQAGDPLTSSSVPGVAMKATGPGDIIGTALEGYDGTEASNQIMVQLHVGYDNPGAQNGVLQGDQNVTGNLSVTGNATINGNTTLQGSMTVAGGINISGASTLTTLLVGNTITDSGNLEVDGTAVLDNLQLQDGSVSGNFNVAGNTSLASLLVGNDISVNGNLSVTGSASIANLTVSGTINTQNLAVNGTTSLNGDIQLTAKVNSRQATIKTFTASVPIVAGSVVVLDNSQGNAGNVTTTTTANDSRVIGVAVTSTTAANQPVQVAISGWVQVNVDTAKVNGNSPALIQPGQLIVTSSTAGSVTTSASPAPGTILGKSTDNQDTNNQVWIYITLQ